MVRKTSGIESGQGEPTLVTESMRAETQAQCETSFRNIKAELAETVGRISKSQARAKEDTVAEYNRLNPQIYATGDATTPNVVNAHTNWKKKFSAEALAEYDIDTKKHAETYDEFEPEVKRFLSTQFSSAKEALSAGQILADDFGSMLRGFTDELEENALKRTTNIRRNTEDMFEEAMHIRRRADVQNMQDTTAHSYYRRVQPFMEGTQNNFSKLKKTELERQADIEALRTRFQQNVVMPYIGMYAYAEQQAAIVAAKSQKTAAKKT